MILIKSQIMNFDILYSLNQNNICFWSKKSKKVTFFINLSQKIGGVGKILRNSDYLFLVLKSHTIAPPKSPKIKPRGPVMSIPSKGP